MAKTKDHYITRKFLEPWLGEGGVVRHVRVIPNRAEVAIGKRGVGGVMRERGFYLNETESLLQKRVEVERIWHAQEYFRDEGFMAFGAADRLALSRFIAVHVIRGPRMKALVFRAADSYGHGRNALWHETESIMVDEAKFDPFTLMLANGVWSRYIIEEGAYTFSIGVNDPVFPMELSDFMAEPFGPKVLDIPFGPNHLVRIEYRLGDLLRQDGYMNFGSDDVIVTNRIGEDFVIAANKRCMEDWAESWWSCICKDDETATLIKAMIRREGSFKIRPGYIEC